jgi:hypothetical protein
VTIQPWHRVGEAARLEGAEIEAVSLAAAVSTLPIVSYPALQNVADLLMPGDGSVEVVENLTRSVVVDAAAVDGVTFDLDIRRTLLELSRSALEDPSEAEERDLQRLKLILDLAAERLSPLLELEYELAWAWVAARHEARAVIDSLLRDVVFTIAHEDRTGILRWVSAARHRLPSECFESEVGWVLGQLCRARRLSFRPVGQPERLEELELLQAVRRHLGERLIGIHRDGNHLELGSPSLRRRVAISVLATDPVAVRVSSEEEDGRSRSIEVAVHGAQPTRVATGRAAVLIDELGGRRYRLEPLDSVPSPEQIDADTAISDARRWLASSEVVTATVLRAAGTGLVVRLPGKGAAAFLRGVHPDLAVGAGVDVTISHVNPDRSILVVRSGRQIIHFERSRFGIDVEDGTPVVVYLPKPKINSRIGTVVVSRRAAGGGLALDSAVLVTSKQMLHSGLSSIVHARRATGLNPRAPVAANASLFNADDGIVVELDYSTIVDPWDTDRFGRLSAGDRCTALILGSVNFGWFCLVPDGRQGLLHRSQTSRSGESLPVGGTIDVVIGNEERHPRRLLLHDPSSTHSGGSGPAQSMRMESARAAVDPEILAALSHILDRELANFEELPLGQLGVMLGEEIPGYRQRLGVLPLSQVVRPELERRGYRLANEGQPGVAIVKDRDRPPL